MEQHAYWPLADEELQAIELGFRASNWMQETSQGWCPLWHLFSLADEHVTEHPLGWNAACEQIRNYF